MIVLSYQVILTQYDLLVSKLPIESVEIYVRPVGS